MDSSVRVQLYLTPAVPGERLLIDVWEASGKARGRSQDVFRRALVLGLRQMCESGELEDDVVEAAGGEERILGRPRKRRQNQPQGQIFVMPPGFDPRFATPTAGYGGTPVLEAEPPVRAAPPPRRPLPPPPSPDPDPEPAAAPGGLGDLM